MSWNNVVPWDLFGRVVATKDLVGADDIVLSSYTVVFVSDPVNSDNVVQHVFGFCPSTHRFHLSSPILEETADYFKTRSRKYWKSGNEIDYLTEGECRELSSLLNSWGITLEEQLTILRPKTFHNVYIKDDKLCFGVEFDKNEHAFIMRELTAAQTQASALDSGKCDDSQTS